MTSASAVDARGRSASLIRNIAATFAVRGVNLFATVAIVHLAAAKLGTHGYGSLALLLSASVLFSLLDFGLGLNLVNRISGATSQVASRAVSRTWIVLCGFAVVFAVLGLATLLVLPRLGIQSLDDQTLAAWRLAVLIFALAIPASIAQRILYARQRVAEAGAWFSAGQLCALSGAFLVPVGPGMLQGFILAVIGLPTLVAWINVAVIFVHRFPDLRPHLKEARWDELRPDLGHGVSFTTLQLAAYAEIAVDNLLIASFATVAQVAHYDVMARGFGYIVTLVALCAFPLWPALRAGMSGGHTEWGRRVLMAAYGLTIVICLVGGGALAALHGPLFTLWTTHAYAPSPVMAMGFALFTLATALCTVQAMDLNARGEIAVQARFQLIALPLLLAAKVLALLAGRIELLPYCAFAACAARFAVFAAHGRGRELAHG